MKSADQDTGVGKASTLMEQTIREVDIYCLGSFQGYPDSEVLGKMDTDEEVLFILAACVSCMNICDIILFSLSGKSHVGLIPFFPNKQV